MAAAIYFSRQKLNFLIITKTIGGQALLSADVENYLGYHKVNGVELVEKFKEHLKDYKINIKDNEEVNKIEKLNNHFKVITNKGNYECLSILIASGENPRKLNIPGEKEFYNKGVTYCAVCDSPLYANMDVSIIGGGNSAMDAALLAEKYSNKIYIVTINDKLMGEQEMIKKIEASKKMTVIANAKTKEIIGDKFVKSVKLDVNGKEKIINVNGVFIEIGLVPNVEFASLVEKNKWNEIIVDKRNATNIPGIFAAGDVTDVTEKQIITAAGEGGKASLDIIKYLESKNIVVAKGGY